MTNMPTKIITADDGKKYEVEVIREVSEWPKVDETYLWTCPFDDRGYRFSCWIDNRESHNAKRLGIFPNTEQGRRDAELHFKWLCAVTEASWWLPENGQEYWFTDLHGGTNKTVAGNHTCWTNQFPTKEKAEEYANLNMEHTAMMRRYRV